VTLLYRAVVGSRCYGTAGPDSDTDTVEVWLDSPETVLAIGSEVGERGHHVKEENDLQSYSLRRFVSLVEKGNPNIVSSLCAPDYTGPAAAELRGLLPAIHCQQTAQQFVGMALAQIRKYWSGALAASRAPLVDQFGYDTKFAYHIARLVDELREFVPTGRITYPLRTAGALRLVRRGLLSQAEWNRVVPDIEAQFKILADQAKRLPPTPDVEALNRAVLKMYEKYWGLPGGSLVKGDTVHVNQLALWEG
jgi:uncharacterized protein